MENLVPLLILGGIAWWLYRRHQKKAARATLQRREEARITSHIINPAPLPGYDATGSALNEYIMQLLAERSRMTGLDAVTVLLRGAHHEAFGEGDRKAIKRQIEVITDSAEIIRKSKNVETVKSRLEVMHINLTSLHNIYFIQKAKKADTHLKQLEPQIITSIYCRSIHELYKKMLSLKTKKAIENCRNKIYETIDKILLTGHLCGEEVAALRRFFTEQQEGYMCKKG